MKIFIQILDILVFFFIQPQLFAFVLGEERLKKMSVWANSIGKTCLYYSEIIVVRLKLPFARADTTRFLTRAKLYRLHRSRFNFLEKVSNLFDQEDEENPSPQVFSDEKLEQFNQDLDQFYDEIKDCIRIKAVESWKQQVRNSAFKNPGKLVQQLYKNKLDFEASLEEEGSHKQDTLAHFISPLDWLKIFLKILISFILIGSVAGLQFLVIRSNWHWSLIFLPVIYLAVIFGITFISKFIIKIQKAIVFQEFLGLVDDVDSPQNKLRWNLYYAHYVISYFAGKVFQWIVLLSFALSILCAAHLIRLPLWLVLLTTTPMSGSFLVFAVNFIITGLLLSAFLVALFTRWIYAMQNRYKSLSRVLIVVGIFLFALARVFAFMTS